MMKVLSPLLLLGAIASLTTADDFISCGVGNKCPEDKPCCSQYGTCGTGAYCLGPCNPKFSYNSSACAPAPVCKSGTYTFRYTDNLIFEDKYLGNTDQYDFVRSDNGIRFGNFLLFRVKNNTMSAGMTSTRAIWYGKVSVTFRSLSLVPHGASSSFVLISGVQDKIAYEFDVRPSEKTAQTKLYWQEALDYSHSRNVSVPDTIKSFHTYEIDWTEERITWSFDGKAEYVLHRYDTYNPTTCTYEYPETPSFLQLLIRPGEGMDPNNIDLDVIMIRDITIECYDPPQNAIVSGFKSYIYKKTNDKEFDVEITDDTTVMGSFEAVGFDMDKGSDGNLDKVSDDVPKGFGPGHHRNGSDINVVNSNNPTASDISISSKKASSTVDASTVSSSRPKTALPETETSTGEFADASIPADTDDPSDEETELGTLGHKLEVHRDPLLMPEQQALDTLEGSVDSTTLVNTPNGVKLSSGDLSTCGLAFFISVLILI